MSAPVIAADGLKPEYPPPPSVHWLALLGAWLASLLAAHFLVPPGWREMLPNLVFNLWVLYLCIWLRRLDATSRSLYWALATVAGQLILSGYHDDSANQSWVSIVAIAAVVLVSFALPFITIFVIRAELLRHYNTREPVGLKLQPLLALVFSYFYFQFHLLGIARSKKLCARETMDRPSRQPPA